MMKLIHAHQMEKDIILNENIKYKDIYNIL